ncbi:DUF1289 domain-containing protein [Tepidiphilus baoligensis]|uniref:DUF1289 domain-containing protein n=1 Tax=Tepidiphilus baoligensis TaxID=2698687 RepID=A0ABX1QM95_9PROT|nr:DUF1289 domain-containing protein [Tepidiphilus baoligensis]NMH17088.1 DUF1289 domain-containing protein [Tepidiphilus baoligensis]
MTVVTSPCIGVCRLDERTGWCVGCLRTREEIARWRDADEAERRRILAAVVRRRAALGEGEANSQALDARSGAAQRGDPAVP